MCETRFSILWKKITILFVICCFGSGGFCLNTVLALPGSGTRQDPWRIESLVNFDQFVAGSSYWAGFTRLETNVSLAGRVYPNAVIAPLGTPFTGVFDGNGHKITNLNINGGANSYLGLFGNLGIGGEVRNLGIEGGSISGDSLIGGLVGLNVPGGSVSNCYFTGIINGQTLIGGLLGFNDGSVSNSCSAGNVSGDLAVGGLLGANRGSVSSCYSTADVTGDFGDRNFGGLVGENLGLVSNCYSTGSVSADYDVGGLVGDNQDNGSVSNCYSTSDVFGSSSVGGLVGDNIDNASVSNCFWDTNSQTHGVTESIGDNQATATNVAGLPTAQMQTRSTFTDAGWDFVAETANGPNDIWRLCEDLIGYSRLSWEFPLADFLCPNGVDFVDFAFFARHWAEENCGSSNNCDGTDLDLLGSVDINDLKIFVDNWLYPAPDPASNPSPSDGEINVSITADLSWNAGLRAASHDVYFGTNNPPPFIQNQFTTTYDPGTMPYQTTYYWRIDEVNKQGTTPGQIWSFTTRQELPPPPPPP